MPQGPDARLTLTAERRIAAMTAAGPPAGERRPGRRLDGPRQASTGLDGPRQAVDVGRTFPREPWRRMRGIRSAVEPTGRLVANHPVPRLDEERSAYDVRGVPGTA